MSFSGQTPLSVFLLFCFCTQRPPSTLSDGQGRWPWLLREPFFYLLIYFYLYELCCWRRLLRVLWTARRSNQSILKEISPGCSLEGLMLKLKLQYFGYLMQRVDSLEKTLVLGRIGGRRRKG